MHNPVRPALLAVVLLGAALGPMPVQAKPGEAKAAQPRSSAAAVRANPESDRAHAADPAGNYRGLPDWARQALSPGTCGGR